MIRSLLFLFVYLWSASFSAQEEAKTGAQFAHEVDQKIPQLMADFAVPGVALAIIDNGEIVLQKCYGYADMEKGIKVTPQTGFNIGSISKTVTAWGIMKLVEEGKIDLDVPVETYLTRWQLPESEFDSDEVTVRRLLSHTAGLSMPSIGSAGLSYDDLPSLEEWLNGNNDVGGVEIILEPGTKWEYSGGGYAVLQLIIEEVSGQSFVDFMQAQVLDPLGMNNSSFKISDKIRAASATPYDPFGETTEFQLYAIPSAAGFQSTLEDFTRFVIASLPEHQDHLKYNKVLPSETVQHMIEPAPNTKIGGWKYGLGYQTVHIGDTDVYIGHSGSNTGWQASFRIEAASMTGFIAFTNGGGGGNICEPLFCELMKWNSNQTSWGNCWRKVSIANALQRIMEDKGVEEMYASYWALKQEKPDELDFSEAQLNNLGYHYLAKGEYTKAIAVFKLNIEAFPYAYNVYDSYGEALLGQGSREKAVENYKKSVQLNPDNENGIKVLKRLGESTDDMHLQVPVEHLKLLAGEYISTSGLDKKILYEVKNGVLLRVYKDSDLAIKLIPIANNEFVYLGRGLHVVFDTRDPGRVILKVPEEGKFQKVN